MKRLNGCTSAVGMAARRRTAPSTTSTLTSRCNHTVSSVPQKVGLSLRPGNSLGSCTARLASASANRFLNRVQGDPKRLEAAQEGGGAITQGRRPIADGRATRTRRRTAQWRRRSVLCWLCSGSSSTAPTPGVCACWRAARTATAVSAA